MDDAVNLRISNLVYRVAELLSGWVFPPHCLVCAEPGVAERDLCAACDRSLPWQQGACLCCALPLPATDTQQVCGACRRRRPLLEQVHAAFLYARPVDGLLRRFKFHQELTAGRLLAALMAEHLAMVEQPQALVPVSLHPARLRQRGYDQALELAKPLARTLELPLLQGLQRQRATAAQSELDAAQRRRNLRGAFVARSGLPAHVALVDDVMTTGATLHAAALALRRAGVQRVDAWVCARVP